MMLQIAHIFMDDQIKHWRNFGQYIKKAREKFKLSQEGAGRKVDLSRQQWNRLENGKSGTTRETALEIAEKFQLDKKETLNMAGFDMQNSETADTITVKDVGNLMLTNPDGKKLSAAGRQLMEVAMQTAWETAQKIDRLKEEE